MSDSSGNTRLDSVVESVYLKLMTRVGVPLLLALLGYFGNLELGKITETMNTIPQLGTDQKIMGLKIDQMQKDMQNTSAIIYNREEATKDWVIQAQKDSIFDATLKDHDKRLQNLETKTFK